MADNVKPTVSCNISWIWLFLLKKCLYSQTKLHRGVYLFRSSQIIALQNLNVKGNKGNMLLFTHRRLIVQLLVFALIFTSHGRLCFLRQVVAIVTPREIRINQDYQQTSVCSLKRLFALSKETDRHKFNRAGRHEDFGLNWLCFAVQTQLVLLLRPFLKTVQTW